MSDAIVLDVLSSSPVQLDVGDADPIAREEIAELAGRVTTVEGDVSGLSTRVGAAEGALSTLGTTVDGIDARVEAIEADYVTSDDVMGALGGEAPALVAGSSRALLGDPETASWMQRTTAADGAALIESVKGNTLVWNQLIRVTNQTDTINGVTFVSQANGGTITANGKATSGANRTFAVNVLSNHKYLYHGCPTGGSSDTYGSVLTGLPSVIPSNNWDYGSGNMVTAQNDGTATFIVAHIATGHNAANLVFRSQLFDLTRMFGAGNEPATVAEFEALFPLPYYPYDAGSLLPVRMEGIETVGFNLWDEEWESGTISSTTGKNGIDSSVWRTKNYIPVLSGATYYATGTPVSGTDGNMRGRFYAADKTYIRDSDASNQSLRLNRAFTVPSGARFLRFAPQNSQIVDKRICINVSDPARNGEYEPHWSSQRTIPASTYFPDGMRSAGSVRDELTETQAITRVGAVDLGTLEWATTATESQFRATRPSAAKQSYQGQCANYDFIGRETTPGDKQMSSGGSGSYVIVQDSAYTTLASFEAAMSGVMLYYELATPTTTPIDPPLPMSYRTGAGGTERVMVADGTMSAPPIFATRYPLDPADLAASIAPVDGPIAKTNHQVGDLIMLGFTLCKVTTAIARGETIAIGTNVTRTTVAAEIAALS